MEKDYRITKLHGTLIGDNRIPDLPNGETTKVLSSINGKTGWVDLPDMKDTAYGKLADDNTWTGMNTFSDIYAGTISTEDVSFNIAHEPHVRMNRISIASTTEGEMVVGPDQWAPTLFTGIAATYESDGDGTFFFGFDNHEKYNVPVLCYRGSAVIRSYLMGDEGTDIKYEYTLPKKSGTFAFTDDLTSLQNYMQDGFGEAFDEINALQVKVNNVNVSTMTEKEVAIVKEDATDTIPFIQSYTGIYGCYRISERNVITISGNTTNDVMFVGYPIVSRNNTDSGYLIGSIYVGTPMPRSVSSTANYSFVGTGTYKFADGKINPTPIGWVGNEVFGGLALLANHTTSSDEITAAIENGASSSIKYDTKLMAIQYDFKETTDGSAINKTFLGYVDNSNDKLILSGLFDGKQGTATLEKDTAGSWVSNTPVIYSDIKETYLHTIVVKEGAKIIFAANREMESATPATTLETLISTFSGTTTAGFGDYILLTVDTTAKLTKQDGTEVDLSTLTITISDTVK